MSDSQYESLLFWLFFTGSLCAQNVFGSIFLLILMFATLITSKWKKGD